MRMKRFIKIALLIVSILIVILFVATLIFVKGGFYQKMEQSYQQSADEARIADMHYLAKHIEQYKTETGHYPFQEDAKERGAAIYFEINKESANDFAALLSQGLNKETCVPHDPQQIQINVPNWYIYEVGPNDYFVTAHLHNERASARRMDNRHGNAAPEALRNGYYYQIGSKEISELMIAKFLNITENIARPDTLPNGCPSETTTQ